MHTRTPALRHSIPTAFIFLLIGLFALMSLTLTLIGTRVYRHIAESSAQNSDSQIVLNYIANKVRTCDAQGDIRVETKGGLQVLCLFETLEGDRYETAIYVYDGSLWERFALASLPFTPEDGERLTQAKSLAFRTVRPRLLSISVDTVANGEQTLLIALRSAPDREAS